MRARYKKELNKVSLTIETNQFYKEDYQMKMLRENNIEGLIKVECHHINNESHFSYDISNMCSLKRKFELVELNSTEMVTLVNDLIRVVDELQQYLLNPDCLLLDSSLVYWDKSKWNFLYLPIKGSDLSKAFHGLTEYFVKTLDYSEVEGIKIASFLHKETLQENFNLREILGKYEERYKIDAKGEERGDAKEGKERGGVKGEKIKSAQEILREEVKDEEGWHSTEMRGITTEDYQTNEGLEGMYEKRIPIKGIDKSDRSDRKDDKGESKGCDNVDNPKKIDISKARFSFLGKGRKGAGVKNQKNRWGDWEDLIIE